MILGPSLGILLSRSTVAYPSCRVGMNLVVVTVSIVS